jgi:HD-like signal output (HDOD) protein
MTPVLLFAALGALGLLPLAAWWRKRRRATLPAMAGDATDRRGVGTVADVAADSRAEPAGAGPAPEAKPLLRRLHALAFDAALPAADGQGDADPRHAVVADAAAAVLARIDAEPRYIPRRPQLLPQLMRAVNDPRASLDGIARIIGQDPALAANLLRVANSPFHRVRKEPVESLTRALALLGLDGVRPVIAAALVQPVVEGGEGVFGRLPALVWEHTQLAAAAASGFARAHGEDDAFAAQLLGLLHGLGAIIVVQVLRDQYARQPDLAPDARTVVSVLEEWTAPSARRIADGWGLTARIGEALEAQRHDAPPADRLGRALRAGGVAGALALLCRLGQMEDAEGFASLSAFAAAHGGLGDVARLWERLSA